MRNKIMHFLVHNGFLFTVAVMCLVHATLLVITLIADVLPLMFYNIFSVVVYLFCILLCKYGHIMPVFVSIILEVSIYSSISVFLVGWECGSFFLLCSIVPIVIYFGCFLFKGSKRWIIVFILLFVGIEFVVLYIGFSDRKPDYAVIPAIRMILMVFSSFAMIISMIFYNVVYIYSSEFEMNSLEQKNVQLSADALEDSLTGLLNRRGFLPLVDEQMSLKNASHFCIAFMDIDNFKRINDSYGHDCGDEVLKHISAIIKREMHGCPICRWGGEEIIVLMKDYDFSVAKKKMEYIRNTIELTPTVFYNKRIPSTITIGLEEYAEDYSEPEEIIRKADERMYYGKQHGKNILIYEDAE